MKPTTPSRPRRQRPTPAQMAIKSGDAVLVRLDSGIRMATTTTSEPWLSGGVWVIRVEDIPRPYDLIRVVPAAEGGRR